MSAVMSMWINPNFSIEQFEFKQYVDFEHKQHLFRSYHSLNNERNALT